jgi:hypothetical protein
MLIYSLKGLKSRRRPSGGPPGALPGAAITSQSHRSDFWHFAPKIVVSSDFLALRGPKNFMFNRFNNKEFEMW